MFFKQRLLIYSNLSSDFKVNEHRLIAMKIEKSHKILAVVIVIAAFLVVENTLLKPAYLSRYTGIQIYDAIRDFKSLEQKGFDVIVNVQGMSDSKPLQARGSIAETSTGWFLMKSNGLCRIVEGPMGSKDILANLIYFEVSPTISVEAVFGPEKTTDFAFKTGFRRVKGSIAFDDASISPTLLQELRNTNKEFYSLSPGRVEIIPISSGFVLDIKVPVPISEISGLVGNIKSDSVQTGYMYYYTGVDDENEIQGIRQDLEGKGAILVNYYKQR